MSPRRREPRVVETTALVTGPTDHDATGGERTDESTRAATETFIATGRASAEWSVVVGQAVCVSERPCGGERACRTRAEA
jgi:hypothetical protein